MGIHDRLINTTLPNLESKIRNSKYLEANKQDILDFECFLYSQGLKPIGILRYLSCLNMLATDAQKEFRKMDRKDVQEIVARLERSNWAEQTKTHYRLTIKRFFKYIQGEQNAAEWVKTSIRRSEKKLPEGLLTEAEIKSMIEVASHPRDKAIISVLYDSGCRIGELGTLQIKNVAFDQYGAVINVHGKTGSRRVRILFSVPYLSAWLDIHPLKNKNEAYVFVNTKGIQSKTMTHNAYLKVIKKLALKAGIQKRIHPHLFRHSRATELAKHLTEAQMNSHLGWVPGSGMSGVYVHLSGRDVDDAILGMYGRKKEEEIRPELTAKICTRCSKENGPTSSFCTQCGSPLNIQAVREVEDSQRKLMQTIEMLMKTEDFKALWDRVSVGNDQ